MSIQKWAFAVIMAVCMAAAQPCQAFNLRAGQIKSITRGGEKGWKYEREIKECSSFTLTKQEVSEYFRRAAIVPEPRVHDLYWSACYVAGTAVIRGKAVNWKVNALGAATVVWPDTGKVQYFYEGEPPGMH